MNFSVYKEGRSICMRTSSQLNVNGSCERNAHSNISGNSRDVILSQAQRNVTKRLLKGEPIEDIAGEIDSILKEKGFVWENFEQRTITESLYEKRILRFCDYMKDKQIVFPDGYDTVVDYFGEPIEAKPDYFIVNENEVQVCRITTSRYDNDTDDISRPEMYALGLCGRKLFPNSHIYVNRVHLASNSYAEANDNCFKRNDRGVYLTPFDSTSRNVSQLAMDGNADAFFASLHEEEGTTTCMPEECARCPQNNICHYEAPPISVDVVAAVRPITEIRMTNAQRQVVDFERGVARVDAGPGGGKTLVTAMRISNLLQKGYEPEDFCLLTYTNAGAREMTARVMNYAASNGVPLDPERLCSGTINSFCQNIIVAHYEELGYTAPPRVLPEEKRKKIINDLIDKYPKISDWKYDQRSDQKFAMSGRYSKSALKMASDIFSVIKNKQLTKETFESEPTLANYSQKDITTIFSMYDDFQKTIKRMNLLEFDDQLIEVNKLYDAHPSLFNEMGFKHILIDEFQDTNLDQIKLLQKMIDTPQFLSFMAVGDDSQAIFGFRHTSPEFIIHFGDYFGRFSDFALVENHRSFSSIVDFANKINDKANEKVEKALIPTRPEGGRPIVQGYYSKKQETEAIAEDISRRWTNGERNIAVLCPTKAELKSMASALTKYDIPSVLMCPTPFVENSRVAALKTFYDSFSGNGTQGFVDYQNILNGGALLGATADQLEQTAEDMALSLANESRDLNTFLQFADALDADKTDSCYQEFLDRVRFCRTTEELQEFWQEFNIYGATSEYKREGIFEGVCLNTIHSAKGLEWDTTYLSLSKLDKPSYHSRHFEDSKAFDEVIRLFFVGATRARNNLIITGEYIVNMDRTKGPVFNQFLKMAYDTLGRPFEYNYASYKATKEQEKEEIQQAANVLRSHPRPDPSVIQAINRYNARHARSEQERERE